MALGGFWTERAKAEGMVMRNVLQIVIKSPAEHLGIQALCVSLGVHWGSFVRDSTGDNVFLGDRLREDSLYICFDETLGRFIMVRGVSASPWMKIASASEVVLDPKKYVDWMLGKPSQFAYYVDLSWVHGDARNTIIDKILDTAISKGYPVKNKRDYYNKPCIAMHQWDKTVCFNNHFVINQWPGVTSKEISVNQALRGEYESV